MPTGLELSIYRTLAYFAYFKYPLTTFELWKWLLAPGQNVSLLAVIETLENSTWLNDRIKQHSGFYTLDEVEVWVLDRHVRFLDAVRKFNKAKKWAQWLGRMPWIEGVAVCNSLSWYLTKADSDIDLFVVTKPGRIWSTRLLSTLPAILLRQRPGEAVRDPVCLSFFCTNTSLDFEKLQAGTFDPYLAYWCYALVPLVDHAGWLAKFKAQNPWLQILLPNATQVSRAHRFRPSVRLRLPWLPLSEHLPRQLQMDKFPTSIKDLMNKDSRVVINDAMLKFHEHDARENIALTLHEKMAEYEQAH